MTATMPALAYTPLERLTVPSTVDRITYIREACRGKVVLDLGCFDETATQKRATSDWLHGQIASAARSVLGVDNSTFLPPEGLKTADHARIVRGDVMRLQDLSEPFRSSLESIEVIVAGELIEHLTDTSAFLNGLRCNLPGRDLILSTPNATSLTNVLVGLGGRENNHPDHLQIYSYKTLNTLFNRASFRQWTITPYFMRYSEMKLRSRPAGRTATSIAETMVNAAERLFPLLAGGLIGHVYRI